MKTKERIRFFCFLIGCIYVIVLLLFEFIGIGLYASINSTYKAGLPINCESLIRINGPVFFRAFYLPLISNIIGFLGVGILLLKRIISEVRYWGIVAIIFFLLCVDIYVLSSGALHYVILGLPFHVYFLYVLVRKKYRQEIVGLP